MATFAIDNYCNNSEVMYALVNMCFGRTSYAQQNAQMSL